MVKDMAMVRFPLAWSRRQRAQIIVHIGQHHRKLKPGGPKAIDGTLRHSYTAGMKSHHQAEAVADLAHLAARTGDDADRFLADWQHTYSASGGTIHCRSGCAGCCSLAVNCTFPEALRLAPALSALQHERLRNHIVTIRPLAQRATTMAEWLRLHRRLNGGCPFLSDDGTCGVYAVRPVSCRALLATKEPGWCTMDFSSLTSTEKQQFMASLDQSVVAFPLHYVAAARAYGEELEQNLLRDMARRFGFALYGNLPVLVWLVREHGLDAVLSAGRSAAATVVAEARLDSPFLVTIVP
jgi:Fe-S-cluster containining protein